MRDWDQWGHIHMTQNEMNSGHHRVELIPRIRLRVYFLGKEECGELAFSSNYKFTTEVNL